MSKLSLTEFIITLALLLGALYLAAQYYQSWLQDLTSTTINSQLPGSKSLTTIDIPRPSPLPTSYQSQSKPLIEASYYDL